MGLTTAIWHGIKGLFRLVALPVTKLRGSRRAGKVLRWTLHFACVAGVLAGLGLANYALDLPRLLRAPWPALRAVWLPLLFLLVYLLAWMGWWLWRLLETPPDASAHPDIDRAWEEARQALEHAGIDLTATPLFLILGHPAGHEAGLFGAAGLPLMVPPVPRRPDAPLRVAANSEGIYVSCPDLSLLARQGALLAEPPEPAPPEPDDPGANLGPRRAAKTAAGGDEIPDVLGGGPSTGETVTQGQQQLEQAVALLVEEDERPAPESDAPQESARLPRVRRRRLLDETELIDRCTVRLAHLCERIARDRRPYCPVNGVLVLISLAATDGQQEANETAVLLERDLDTVHQALQVNCPLVAVVCDTEQAPGAEDLLDRFPEEQRKRRLGVALPPLADCEAAALPEVLREAVRWTCQDLVPPLVYRLVRVGGSDGVKDETEQRGNVGLYQFLHDLRRRQDHLARILTRAIAPGQPRRWLPAGLYLAATGPDAVRQQGFAGGIFPQLLEIQNDVSWNRQALAEDATCRRWAKAGYAALAALVAAAVAVAAFL